MQEILARDIPVLALYSPDSVLVFRPKVLDSWYFTPGQFPTPTYNSSCS